MLIFQQNYPRGSMLDDFTALGWRQRTATGRPTHDVNRGGIVDSHCQLASTRTHTRRVLLTYQSPGQGRFRRSKHLLGKQPINASTIESIRRFTCTSFIASLWQSQVQRASNDNDELRDFLKHKRVPVSHIYDDEPMALQ
jgi:hypothetical protein